MKLIYSPPQNRSVTLQAEDCFCKSSMDKGSGAVDAVMELDFESDDWTSVY